MSAPGWAVAIGRQVHRPPVVVGPFRSEEGAIKRADAIGRALKRAGLYNPVDVVPLDVGATPLRDVVEDVR